MRRHDHRHQSVPRFFAIAVSAAALMFAAACGGTTGNESAGGKASSNSNKPLVYGVFATPLEEPWDGALHTALKAAADDGKIVYKHVDNLNTSDAMERSLRDIASNEKPDAIVGDAFAAEEAVRKVAAEFPNIPFAFGSGEKPVAPNMSVFDNWLQDPAYLAGMLAGGLTKSNTIGIVAAMPIPEVNRIANAFVDGAQAVNPDVKVKISFINSFFDPAAAKQAAQAQISAGADVLFAERDGVITAAKESKIPVIGMMIDQKSEAPEFVATSLIWHTRPTIDAVIEQALKGPQGIDLGKFSFMKEKGSELAPLNTDIVGGIPDDLVKKIEAKKKEILDGTVTTKVDESAPAGSIDASKK